MPLTLKPAIGVSVIVWIPAYGYDEGATAHPPTGTITVSVPCVMFGAVPRGPTTVYVAIPVPAHALQIFSSPGEASTFVLPGTVSFVPSVSVADRPRKSV